MDAFDKEPRLLLSRRAFEPKPNHEKGDEHTCSSREKMHLGIVRGLNYSAVRPAVLFIYVYWVKQVTVCYVADRHML